MKNDFLVLQLMENVIPELTVWEARVRVFLIVMIMKLEFVAVRAPVPTFKIIRALARPLPQWRQLVDRTIAGFPPEMRVEFDEEQPNE